MFNQCEIVRSAGNNRFLERSDVLSEKKTGWYDKANKNEAHC